MSTLRSSYRSLQACYARARYHHLLGLVCRRNLHTFYLSSDDRIDSTTTCTGCRTFSHTSIATETSYNLLIFSCHNLVRQERISKQRTTHIYHICLSLSDDLLHLSRIVDRTYSSHRLGNVFLDFCSKMNVHTVLRKHRRSRNIESELI